MCEVRLKPSLDIKPVVLEDWGSPKTCVIRLLRYLCRRQTDTESTSCRWHKEWPMGSKLYNSLYWNQIGSGIIHCVRWQRLYIIHSRPRKIRTGPFVVCGGRMGSPCVWCPRSLGTVSTAPDNTLCRQCGPLWPSGKALLIC